MNAAEPSPMDEFATIVDTYIKTESESALYQASELGRRLVAQQVGPEELVAMHFRVMQRIAADQLPDGGSGHLLQAFHVLLEVVMAHGLAFREYLEAREAEFQRIQQLSAQIQQQKEEITTAHQQLQTVIDQMVDGLVEMDAAGRVLLANPAAEQVLEAPSAQLVYRLIWDCLLPVRHDDFYKATMDMQRDKTPIHLLGTKGESYYKLTLAPVLDEEGRIHRTLLLIRDVTKEEEANRVRNELVSMVSHELRTPMTSIVGFSELLLKGGTQPSKQTLYQQIIHDEARRLGHMVDAFLDIQRMEAGAVTYHKEIVALPGLIERVAQSFVGQLPHHSLRLELAERLPAVLADSDRIAQVLTNFISNAIKYSPQGGEVRIAAAQIGEDMVTVSVEDHGLGIPAEALPNLFTKFYRVDLADRREIGGTGLGLAICREIIHAHGGRIWAESQLGEGSTFFFTLPIARGEP